MENLKYISSHNRVQLVYAYANTRNLVPAKFAKYESYLFENPTNRALIDKGIERADMGVDEDRYTQYSDEWYREVVRDIPQLTLKSDAKTQTCLPGIGLTEKQVKYLATVILLASRGGDMKEVDIVRACTVAAELYKKLVNSN